MKPTLRDAGPPKTLGQVREFFRSLGLTVADDYQAFLVQSNGGVFHDEVYYHDGVDNWQIGGFFGIDSESSSDDLALVNARKWEEFDGFLPIANTLAADYIAISCKAGSSFGRVFFLDSDLLELSFGPPTDTECPYGNEMARSVSELVERLRISEEGLPLHDGWARWIGLDDRISFEKGIREFGIQAIIDEELLGTLARHSRIEMIRLLAKEGLDVTLVGKDGLAMMHRAAASDCRDCVRLLVQLGASIHQPSAIDKQTPLHLAVLGYAIRTSQFLIDLGADLHVQDSKGRSALDLISQRYLERELRL